ncbi:hypothetical protein HHK36_028792 [Tetracentron sinense]|uniref:Uncharacterized protein n=1 Tax=Tetracentron sinense TaxID=13715 RepID=A0A834YBS0_TETSI|nr:hypothetical protein HHK36_028792 [Tetracentron sinense]
MWVNPCEEWKEEDESFWSENHVESVSVWEICLKFKEDGSDYWNSNGDDRRDRFDGWVAPYDEVPKHQACRKGYGGEGIVHEDSYRLKVLQAVDIKLLGSLNREDLKKICGDNFPEWISFPVYYSEGVTPGYATDLDAASRHSTGVYHINIKKPLRPYVVLELASNDSVIFPVTYEKLPTVCFSCGCMGHDLKHCDTRRLPESSCEVDEPYFVSEEVFGPWLRAEMFHYDSWPLHKFNLQFKRNNQISVEPTALADIDGEKEKPEREEVVFPTGDRVLAEDNNRRPAKEYMDAGLSEKAADSARNLVNIRTIFGRLNHSWTGGEYGPAPKDEDMQRSSLICTIFDGKRDKSPVAKRCVAGHDLIHQSFSDPQAISSLQSGGLEAGSCDSEALGGWNKYVFRNINSRKQALIAQLESLQRDPQLQETKILQQKLTQELDSTFSCEEAHWRQKARIDWLHLGDKNTKFFQASAIQRRQRNCIYALRSEDGRWVTLDGEISSLITGHFSSLFSSINPEGIEEILTPVTPKVTMERNSELCKTMRNAVVFNGEVPDPESTIGKIERYIEELNRYSGRLKDQEDSSHPCSSRLAEGEALRRGLILAMERSWPQVIIESDSKESIDYLNGSNSCPQWDNSPMLEDILRLRARCECTHSQAATMVIRESVEPLLEEYRPPGITSLKFSKLSLGNVAPKIEGAGDEAKRTISEELGGIRVQSLKKDQITMDIDFRWGGDPSIILGVEAALVASIPIQLKDLQVFTVVRVIFQLAEEIPCISAVVVALLSEPKPKIDYTLKAVGGSLTAIPGLSDMIDDTVNTIVTDMLQWPHRIVVPIGTGVDTSELELKPQGKLTVIVVKANNLKNMEMIGKSDPYVVVYIRPLFKVKTKVINNNLNPAWDQTFELIAEDKETQSIIFEVLYHQFNKEEQLVALEEEKRILEERKKLKEAGVIGSTMDALGSGVGLVGTGLGAGAGLVGSGIGTGVGFVGTGFGAVSSGLSKAGKFMGRSITGQSSSRKSGSSTPVTSVQENGGAKQA